MGNGNRVGDTTVLFGNKKSFRMCGANAESNVSRIQGFSLPPVSDVETSGFYFALIMPENRSSTAEETLNAQYLQAKYVVFDNSEELVLRVGQKNPRLDALLERESAQTWAFLTAYNPYSKQLTKSENEGRQAELIQLTNSKNLCFLDGYGTSDEPGEWEAEPSILILGIEKEEALGIARKFEQNAILYGQVFQEPELVWAIKPDAII